MVAIYFKFSYKDILVFLFLLYLFLDLILLGKIALTSNFTVMGYAAHDFYYIFKRKYS